MSEELEWQTRRDRINKKLRSVNPAWKIIKYREGLDTSKLTHHAVEEYPTENGPADYALFVNGLFLGVIEAKKLKVSPQNVLEQAKRYSRGAADGVGNWDGHRVPFLYSSNGEIIWHLDVRNHKNISRQISNFHTPPALTEFFNRPIAFNPTAVVGERLRDYQREAIEKTEEAIANGKRSMLIAMATGTGKTFVTVSLVYRLLESKRFKRILFLVDRRALAAQAVREFASFTTPKGNKFDQEYEVYSQRFQKEDFEENEPFDPKVLPRSYLTEPDASKTFVYVSTIQRMTINLFGWEHAFQQSASDPDYEEDAEKLETPIPIHAFDLIVADECHRGYTAKDTAIWRQTLEHFDAIKVGLTATPASHTTTFFKEVVYRYSTDEAIQDGYLVDYEPVLIKSDVRIKGAFLKEGEHVGVIDTETGQEIYDELEDEREFAAGDIERKITSPDSNRKIIKEIAKYAYRHEKKTGRFPKILIFAVNDLQHTSHCDQLVQICREEFKQGDDFVQKITGSQSVDRPLQKIRQFRNRPNPKVVITVDMLSTGVDIPSLEFVVFMRPVKSRILWVQMLGRGTRLCPEIHKSHFKIFDCFGGSLIEYFKNTTDFKVEVPDKQPLSIAQVIENIYQNVDRKYYTKVLVKRLRRIERNMSGEAREKFALYIEDGDMNKFADELSHRIAHDFTKTMQLLRDQEFQDLLVNYPRAKRVFYRAYELEDQVTSEELFEENRTAADYLDAFASFVKANQVQISAIQILMERPKEWKTNVLEELRVNLRKNKFPPEKLQKAHERVYHKALADIISMVKHAAREAEPIFNAEERVSRALDKFMAGKSFNKEQQKWLGFLKEHLIQNLSLEMEDFEYAPVFERNGGLGKAMKVFGKGLESMVEEINYRVAA